MPGVARDSPDPSGADRAAADGADGQDPETLPLKHNGPRIPGVERLIGATLAAAVLVIGGEVALHQTADHVVAAVLGVSSLSIAWLVWRYGIIGYAYPSDSDPEEPQKPTAAVVDSPLPREWVTPVLLLVALVLLLAASPWFGSVLDAPLHAGVATGTFLQASWELVTGIAGTLALLWVLGSMALDREMRWRGLGCLTSFLLFAVAVNLGYYLIAPQDFHTVWRDFLSPIRTVIEWF